MPKLGAIVLGSNPKLGTIFKVFIQSSRISTRVRIGKSLNREHFLAPGPNVNVHLRFIVEET